MPHGRHDARERALGLLYEASAKECSVAEVLEELPVEPAPYAVDLARRVEANREELDQLIERHAREDWELQRMPVIDLTLLRMAAEELVRQHDVPVAVVISEAVSLAKEFSTDEAGRFVNGVLAAIASEVRGGPADP